MNVRVSDGTFTSGVAALVVSSRASFANNVAPVIENTCAASCHFSGNGVGAPSFMDGGNASFTEIFTRAAGELTCANNNPPTSLLLAKPSTTVAHTGSLQPGFDLSGNRSTYDLFKAWICTFNRANN